MGNTDLRYMGRILHDCNFIRSVAGYDIYTFSFAGENCYVVCIPGNLIEIVIALFSMYADLEAFIKVRNEVE